MTPPGIAVRCTDTGVAELVLRQADVFLQMAPETLTIINVEAMHAGSGFGGVEVVAVVGVVHIINGGVDPALGCCQTEVYAALDAAAADTVLPDQGAFLVGVKAEDRAVLVTGDQKVFALAVRHQQDA